MGGEFIHSRYGGNLYAALSSSFPDHGWQRLMFSKAASTQPASGLTPEPKSSMAAMLDTIYRELALANLDQWISHVSLNHLYQFGILEAVLEAGGLPALLRSIYPNHPWPHDEKFLSHQAHSEQDLIVSIVLRHASAKRDHHAVIIKNFKHPILQFLDGPRKKQLAIDVFAPDHQIGIISNATTASYERTIAAAKQANLNILLLTPPISLASLKTLYRFLSDHLKGQHPDNQRSQ
eukprot:TRINITY_DN13529_c0_g1_i1.p1 TRINITY_DN13529_c0_g1~~TRINITY_DN13529_c0_g1_i1.p1  ORF type:complete len:265 (+),score=34.13 TRINITY_DN13529_c0_g1_i1:93-797(+)